MCTCGDGVSHSMCTKNETDVTRGLNGCINIYKWEPYASSKATATTTPSKKCVSILLWNFSFVEYYSERLSVLEFAPDEYATNAFSSK